MNKLTLLALVASLFSLNAIAHPGRTASDGCHYCRTNCAKWGVEHGVRHCHGGLKPEIKTQTIEAAVNNNRKPEMLEVSHSHGSETAHSHTEQYN